MKIIGWNSSLDGSITLISLAPNGDFCVLPENSAEFSFFSLFPHPQNLPLTFHPQIRLFWSCHQMWLHSFQNSKAQEKGPEWLIPVQVHCWFKHMPWFMPCQRSHPRVFRKYIVLPTQSGDFLVFFYNVLCFGNSKLNPLLKQNKSDDMYFIFRNFLLGLSPPLPHPTVHSVLVSTDYQRMSHFNLYFSAFFNTSSHFFFTFDFDLSDCTTVCGQKTQRLHFSSAFPAQEQHSCSDLKLPAQALHLSTGQEVKTLGRKLFRWIGTKKFYILMLVIIPFKITFPLPSHFPFDWSPSTHCITGVAQELHFHLWKCEGCPNDTLCFSYLLSLSTVV